MGALQYFTYEWGNCADFEECWILIPLLLHSCQMMNVECKKFFVSGNVFYICDIVVVEPPKWDSKITSWGWGFISSVCTCRYRLQLLLRLLCGFCAAQRVARGGAAILLETVEMMMLWLLVEDRLFLSRSRLEVGLGFAEKENKLT